MHAFINNQKVNLFKGATLKHALLKADEAYYHAVKAGKAEIRDQEGNLVEIGGYVDENFSYRVVTFD